jgi:hypothetical protein
MSQLYKQTDVYGMKRRARDVAIQLSASLHPVNKHTSTSEKKAILLQRTVIIQSAPHPSLANFYAQDLPLSFVDENGNKKDIDATLTMAPDGRFVYTYRKPVSGAFVTIWQELVTAGAVYISTVRDFITGDISFKVRFKKNRDECIILIKKILEPLLGRRVIVL